MSDEKRPTDDLKEGMGLIFRAAKKAAKQVDLSKIDKGLDTAISQVGRAVANVGRAVGDEINRIASSPPFRASGAAASEARESDEAGVKEADGANKVESASVAEPKEGNSGTGEGTER